MKQNSVSMRMHQQAQQEHDLQNHFDILSMSRQDRLKHYGLHFAKYAGRFARGSAETKSRAQTLVDAFLVALSAANTLNQPLPDPDQTIVSDVSPSDQAFTDYAGRFADACEKIDHMEDFRTLALSANIALVDWILRSARVLGADIDELVRERRLELSVRSVYASLT